MLFTYLLLRNVIEILDIYCCRLVKHGNFPIGIGRKTRTI